MQEVEGAWNGIMQQQQAEGTAQQQQQADPGADPQADADEDVVDADFEEVK